MSHTAGEGSECSDCGASVQGAHCHACGEPVAWPPLDERRVAAELLDSLLSLDSRFWRTLRDLVVHPGRVAREYAWGRRSIYFGPIKCFVLACTALILCMLAAEHALGYRHAPAAATAPASAPPAAFATSSVVSLASRHARLTFLLLLPLLASTLGFSFRSTAANYAERLTLTIYVASAFIVVLAFAWIAGAMGARLYGAGVTDATVWNFRTLSIAVFFLWLILLEGTREFYQVSHRQAALGSFLAVLSWLACGGALMAALAGIALLAE